MFGGRTAPPLDCLCLCLAKPLFAIRLTARTAPWPSASVAELNVRSKQSFRAVEQRAPALSHKADLVYAFQSATAHWVSVTMPLGRLADQVTISF